MLLNENYHKILSMSNGFFCPMYNNKLYESPEGKGAT